MYRQSEKNLLSSHISCTWPHNMVNFAPLAAEIVFVSLGHPCKFQRVSCLGSITAWHSSSGRQPNFAALNRARHLYSTGWPSRWALAHISSYFFSLHNYFSFIIVSVYVAFIFHLIITKFTLYPLLDYTLYRIVPVYLLQAYKHTSVDASYTYISCD